MQRSASTRICFQRFQINVKRLKVSAVKTERNQWLHVSNAKQFYLKLFKVDGLLLQISANSRADSEASQDKRLV